MKLIAKVTVLCLVAGVRTEIAPGEQLPELPKHDVDALLAMGSIEDADAVAAQAKADAKAEREDLKDFEAARQAVMAQAASTVVEPPPEAAVGSAAPAPAPKAPPAAKKAAK